jgi:hypothetical protein
MTSMMRLTVRDDCNQFNQQTHAYAEYRAFSRIVANDLPADEVLVSLASEPAADVEGNDASVVCRIVVTMQSGEVAEASATAAHAYAAIDRAVSLIRPGRAPRDGLRHRWSAPDDRESA